MKQENNATDFGDCLDCTLAVVALGQTNEPRLPTFTVLGGTIRKKFSEVSRLEVRGQHSGLGQCHGTLLDDC